MRNYINFCLTSRPEILITLKHFVTSVVKMLRLNERVLIAKVACFGG